MVIVGHIKLIEDTQNINGNFKKRVLVLTTDEKYPQHISIEFQQEKTSLLDKFDVNDKVSVGINIRGKEWVDKNGKIKYFNTIIGWRIDRIILTI